MVCYIFIAQCFLNLTVKGKKIYTAAPKKGITVQACTYVCMFIRTFIFIYTIFREGNKISLQLFYLAALYNNITTINYIHINKTCLKECIKLKMHSHTDIKKFNLPTKSIHSKVHKFMVMAETSTFGILYGRNVRGRNVLAEMSVAETSVAEISYIHL